MNSSSNCSTRAPPEYLESNLISHETGPQAVSHHSMSQRKTQTGFDYFSPESGMGESVLGYLVSVFLGADFGRVLVFRWSLERVEAGVTVFVSSELRQ